MLIAELRRETEDRIARERALLGRLDEIGVAAPEDWEDVLDVAGALRWAIARAGEPAVAALVARVRDPDARVRMRAVRALGDLEGAAVTEALSVLVGDADDEVADLAALALAARAGFEARSPQEPGASSPTAEQALSRVLPRLVAMIVAGSRDVEAAEVLGALAARSAAVEQEIAAALTDGLRAAGAGVPRYDFAARSRLAQALGEIPRGAARAALGALVADPDPAVARVACYLVGRAQPRRRRVRR
ncbi:HEAT repeat domain-containing protein [Leucobacter sp. wl10]|uniref:HEAT repeat domain-containing protein n=1 Tax=Leucobacter sp. wl10 TaxID=2304677 RepID=UPI000E5BDB63|nr:HEAT repeat domain-containing protein [Leucobacter sp. wl10]RGE22039.1 hypothetical protein D1J51_06005 [Leucobacter sp. wl10]